MNGNRTVTATFNPPLYPPTVTTNPAQNITSSTATLWGTLTDMGTASSAAVSFQWGLTTGYGTETNTQTMTSPGSFSINLSGLSPDTTYHFMARAVGHGTAYGSDMQFTTLPLRPPNQPPNVYPIQGALCVNLPVTLQSAPFSDPDPGDTHAASQWQVRTGAGSLVYDSGADSVQLTSMTLSDSELDWGTDYYWRLRHHDSHGLWSGWSTETHFIVADTPAGSEVTVLRTGTDIHFNIVNIGGCTWVNTSNANPGGPTPSSITRVGPFTDILTTATYSGWVNVGVPYNPSGIPDEQKLRIFHWEQYKWVDVTTSVDTNSKMVYGRVASLSWFFIGGQWVWIPEGPSPVVPRLITTPLVLLDSLLDHFVTGQPTQFYLQRDFEWVSEPGSYQLTTKGNYLLGAISDIMTYGSVLVDWVTQSFVGRIIGN